MINAQLVNEPPKKINLHSDRLLMGSGPSKVHPDVLKVSSNGTIGHLDPAMIAMMEELKDMHICFSNQ